MSRYVDGDRVIKYAWYMSNGKVKHEPFLIYQWGKHMMGSIVIRSPIAHARHVWGTDPINVKPAQPSPIVKTQIAQEEYWPTEEELICAMLKNRLCTLTL